MSERATAAHRIGQPGPSQLRSVTTLLRCWGPATVTTMVLAFLALLYVSPDASRAAVVASVVVLALAAIASSYVRSSLTDLADQVERQAQAHQRAEVRRLNADRVVTSPVADAELAREIEAAVKAMTASLTLIAEQWRAITPETDGNTDLAALEQAVSKAVAECNQITLGFAANLPADHRHRFNNAVMPLSYALDKATKRLTRLLHREAPARVEDTARVPALLDGARASAEHLGTLVRRLGAA